MAGSSIYFANSSEGARTFIWLRSLVGPPGVMVDGWNGPLEQVDSFRFQIPRSYKPQMRTSGLIFVDEPMIPQLRQDRDRVRHQLRRAAHPDGPDGGGRASSPPGPH